MPMTISGTGTVTGLVAGGLPDATITQPDLASGVAGNGPAFSATRSAVQSITTSVRTKLQASVEEFDTAGAYDNVTNFRFQPAVAGYYQVTANIDSGGTTSGQSAIVSAIWKNGAEVAGTSIIGAVGTSGACQCSRLIFMNGSTDYLEAYGQINATNPQFSSGCFFQAFLARAA